MNRMEEKSHQQDFHKQDFHKHDFHKRDLRKQNLREQDLREQERLLMAEWKTRWQEKHSQYPYFNEDGIIDHDRWNSLPEGKHVLILLKETNGLQGSLADFLRNGGSDTYYRTWNNVARWAAMIFTGEMLDTVSRQVLNDQLRNLAVVNLKKYAGGSRANRSLVRKEAFLDRDLLKRQICLYQPDIILAGGWGLTADFLRDEIFQDDSPWCPPDEQAGLWRYRTKKICREKETLVVSMPHPNRAAKRWTWELEKTF